MDEFLNELKSFEFETFETLAQQTENAISFEGKLYKSSRSNNWILLVPIYETNMYYEFSVESILNHIKLSKEDNLFKIFIKQGSKFYKTELLSLGEEPQKQIKRVFRGESGPFDQMLGEVVCESNCGDQCSWSCSCGNCQYSCHCTTLPGTSSYSNSSQNSSAKSGRTRAVYLGTRGPR